MGTEGQDWASYQAPQPDVTGLSFVFIKVTQGMGYTNPHWQTQYEWARKHGLEIGLYHYPDMRNAARDELNHFLDVISKTLGVGPGRVIPRGIMLTLDWEGYDLANMTVSHANQAAYKDDWLHRIANAMPWNRSVLYCNIDYWHNVDATGQHGDALWIATAGLPKGQPGILTPWMFHQYSASGVDRDYCPFSQEYLHAWTNNLSRPPEDIVTPAEMEAVATLAAQKVWDFGLDHLKDDWTADGRKVAARWYVEGKDITDRAQVARDEALAAQLAALQKSVDTLAKALTPKAATTVPAPAAEAVPAGPPLA